MFGLTHSSTVRLLAVELNAALLRIKSAGLPLNLVVFWLVRELSQEKGMSGSTISGGFGRRKRSRGRWPEPLCLRLVADIVHVSRWDFYDWENLLSECGVEWELTVAVAPCHQDPE
jgi:hypothetical protein